MTIDEIKELYKMIAERDDSIGDLISKIADKDTRIAELEATVEQMKRCGNCTRFMIDDHHALYCENDVYPFPIFGKCDKWEGR